MGVDGHYDYCRCSLCWTAKDRERAMLRQMHMTFAERKAYRIARQRPIPEPQESRDE